MPIVRIEDSSRRPLKDQQQLIEIIYQCLRQVLRVSDEELQARYQHLSRETMHPPGDREHYVQITITMFKGRTLNSKRRLYTMIVERLAQDLSIDPKSLLILLDEHEAHNWGMRGGVPACDIDFGYQVQA